VNIPLYVTENDEHVLGLGEFGLSLYGSYFLPKRLCSHFQGLRYTLAEICTKFDSVLLLNPSRDGIRSDTRHQMK
jgi:hypothetical protein